MVSFGSFIIVDPLFENLNRLQLAHPDPVNEEEEDEDDGMMMTENGLVSVEDHVCNLFAQAAVCLCRFCLTRRKNTNEARAIELFVLYNRNSRVLRVGWITAMRVRNRNLE